MTVSMEENARIQMLSATSKDKKTATERSLVEKYHLGPLALHTGLVLSCVTYAVGGAYLFLSIERPEELKRRGRALLEFQELKDQFIGNLTLSNPERSMEIYTKKLMYLLEDAHKAHTFEHFFTDNAVAKDMWTFSSALVFTTTTVIPVGYGYVFPVSAYGRMCLVAYALLGIPLTLVTMADTGKFAAQLVTRWFGEPRLRSCLLPGCYGWLDSSTLFDYTVVGADIQLEICTEFVLVLIFEVEWAAFRKKTEKCVAMRFVHFDVRIFFRKNKSLKK
ncbi:hypothetical protein CAEBREN_30019 [Caenorhabditis brenneri]|uniref:Potassium channel domain-containing protein n=1 Tax=Caenorhabditis brenneri TaxID=135651 RepID=G0PKR9_CAEBE|nr:hypothetical protein CAEBREN_30019 [Caenorhabditis brenneri]